MAVGFTKSISDFDRFMAGEREGLKRHRGIFNPGDPYATGGVAVAVSDLLTATQQADFPNAAIVGCVINSQSRDGGSFAFWDQGNLKMIMFDTDATEHLNAADLSATTFDLDVTFLISISG